MSPPKPLDVAIVGGGFSATVLAALLARDAPAAFRAAIFSRTPPGPGTAYAPQSASLLMNGPVRAMSAMPGDDRHLARYLVEEPDDALICRARYGAYLRATASAAFAHHAGLEHQPCEVVDVERASKGFRVVDERGAAFHAANVVFALGNLAPNDAFLPDAVRMFPGYAGDPWSAPIERFDSGRNVAIVGSRLTAMDTIALLDEVAFRGKVHVISRHGLLPAVEDTSVRGLDPATLDLDPRTPLTLLRSLRRAVRRHSGDWRAVIEALRPVTPAIWQGWSLRERRRFLRHLQSYWAIHRYRVPPATHAAFTRMHEGGRIVVHHGRIVAAASSRERLSLTILDRGRRYDLSVGYVVNCTGPNGDVSAAPQPLIRRALERGLMRPDALRMGADADDAYHLRGADGTVDQRLYAIGPLLRGVWYETTAVGEIRKHAEAIARSLLTRGRPMA